MAFFQFIDPINVMTGLVVAAESLEVSTTDSTGFLQKMRLSAAALPSGQYRVVWTYHWNLDSTSQHFVSRVQVNDTTTLGEHYEEPTDSTGTFESTGSAQKMNFCAIATATLSGNVDIDLDWKSSKSGVSASIWGARMELWRLS